MRISKHTADRLGEKVRAIFAGGCESGVPIVVVAKKYLECKKTVDN